jgi:hypothetical protein
MTLRKRRLGTTELEITAVGFGARAISDLAEIADAIRRTGAGSGPIVPARREAA